ncbi:MAG: ion transporter [Gammaproteobacteria bacterium]|nr:ion transporter [Gammaproteobacteria bacterium]
MDKFAGICRRIVEHNLFSYTITALILVNAILIGLETIDSVHEEYGALFLLIFNVILWIFVIEAALKISAEYPKPLNYFKDGWNVFDFIVIVFCLIPDSSELALIARVLRILRVLSAIPSLRVLVNVLMRSLPSMGNIVLLTLVIFYVYGILGHHLFAGIDPTHWESLGRSLLSLFRIITLEDWTDIMYVAMETYWWAWMYFVSLVLVGTFVVFNLIIAVVIRNHDVAIKEWADTQLGSPNTEQLIEEIQSMHAILDRLSERIEGMDLDKDSRSSA